MSIINRIVPTLSGEIVVFTDASAAFAPDAVELLVGPFSDPAVGAVSGELVLREETERSGEVRVDAYWRLEKFIRRREGEIASTIGATGAIYALRRQLFQQLPEDTILDDLLIPLGAVERGYRVVFQSAARAFEKDAVSIREEFRRKVRTLAGNYQAFSRARWALWPGRGIAFAVFSHKLFRLAVPFALLGLFVACAAGPPLLKPVLVLQAAFYLLALSGWLLTLRGKKITRLFSLPFTFCLLNGAALRAFIVYFFCRRRLIWR